ncbi:Hypothetical protein A7982_05311 [Minicystis rosea]|nr:Hypothetical protein A7982_05311 [Minicystis rosea]
MRHTCRRPIEFSRILREAGQSRWRAHKNAESGTFPLGQPPLPL